MRQIIDRVEAAVREFHAADTTGHDWWHIKRVRDTALRIAEHLPVDAMLVEIAALIHDVGDYKLHPDKKTGEQAVRDLLESCSVPPTIALQAMEIARRISFKGAGVPDDMPSLEGKIVQDADRLDALGAIGIARTFAYGGAKGRMLFDPEQPLVLDMSEAEYISPDKKSSTLHHFDEKLLLLKDRLHTDRAKYMAEELHAFMVLFLKAFHRQWKGDF
ncbi:MAG TPA: HD domain-containing protein [Candidatus Paceibacterota bacterium]|nr:HD domain-containing protein [Candidatus Paceibacterota bacterium]